MDLQSDANEVRSSDGWGGIYDTNRPSLRAALQSMGYEVVDLGIVVDEYDFSPNVRLRRRAHYYFDSVPSHIGALEKGLEMADLIITTGGTSMGPTDLLKPVIERYPKRYHPLWKSRNQTWQTDNLCHCRGLAGKPDYFEAYLCSSRKSGLRVGYLLHICCSSSAAFGGWPEKMCGLPRVQVEVRFDTFNLDCSSAHIHTNIQVQNPMPLDPRVEFHRAIIKSSISDGTGLYGIESL